MVVVTHQVPAFRRLGTRLKWKIHSEKEKEKKQSVQCIVAFRAIDVACRNQTSWQLKERHVTKLHVATDTKRDNGSLACCRSNAPAAAGRH